MSKWGECRAGAGNFIVLKQDGDSTTFVPVGEPEIKSAADKKGNVRKRVFVNVATPEALKDGGKAAIFPMNITTAEAMAKVLKVGEEHKPAESLVGKVAVKVTRKGGEGDIGTKYQVEVKGKLTPAEVKALAKVELNDLGEVEFTPKG